MILEIRHYPDPVLRRKCEPVKEITSEIKELIKSMLETMHQHSEAVGLSACQVGSSKRVAVVDMRAGPRVFINPQILEKRGEELAEEGCLSVPGVFLKIKRAKAVTVEALNENGQTFKIKAEGLLARCLQQEIDHLNGVLIIDRAGWLEKIKKRFFK